MREADVIWTLIRFGADVNCKELIKCNSPLHLTTDLEIIACFVDHGADVDVPNANGNTPVFCTWSDYEPSDANAYHRASSLLLELGADVNATNTFSDTPLKFISEYGGYLDSIRQMIAHGARLEAVNCKSRTALHAALAVGNTKVVSFIL